MHKVEAVMLPAVEEVPAAHLLGRKLEGGWTVAEQLLRDPGASGGYFSVNYIITDEAGRRAFLKALNIAAMFAEGNGSLMDRRVTSNALS